MTVASNAKEVTTQQARVTEVHRSPNAQAVNDGVQLSIRNQIDSYVFAITGSAGANRPVISDENLIHNQRQELALAAEVTLKTVQYFMADHPDPFDAPVKELTQLSNYLNAGMSLPYAARVDFGPYNNYATPQPDVIFPPRKGGSYKLEKGKLMIADTQGGFVPMSTLIACLRQH
jgi:hypothetical protein